MNSEVRKKPVSAAKRMREYRERRRDGWRCVRVTIHEGNIKALIEKRYLEPGSCHDRNAVAIAVDYFLNEAL
jgi:hypothetical protein